MNFKELQTIAEEAMLEERYAIETNSTLTPKQLEKFFQSFDPEVIHNLLQLTQSFADILCEYRGTHIGCDIVNGQDSRCAICRKLETGSFGGALVNVQRVEGKDAD